MDREYYKISDICEIMGCNKDMVYKLVRSGDLPSLKIGNTFFVPIDKFRKWLEEKAVAKEEGVKSDKS